jgi:hypothetical protein
MDVREKLAGSTAGLVAGLALLPGLAGVATALLFFADWPDGRPVAQFAIGTAIGVVLWLALSWTSLSNLGDPRHARSGIFEEVSGRLITVQAQLGALEPGNAQERRAHAQAAAHVTRAWEELGETASEGGLRWLLGSGYVGVWRHVHRTEEALLVFDDAPTLRALAIRDEARLSASKLENEGLYADELRELLGTAEERREPGHTAKVLAKLQSERARWLPILTDVRNTLNRHRVELFNDLVHLRNLLFAATVATGVVIYTVLGLAVVYPVERSVMAAGMAFYLVGSVVGLFSEVYTRSRRVRGVSDEIGLEFVRLLTIPQLSGIAGVLGVVITRLGGTATASGTPTLQDVFSLADYPFGLVVAAIFGLTPGLLLARLRQQTDEYKEELARTGTGGEKPAQG